MNTLSTLVLTFLFLLHSQTVFSSTTFSSDRSVFLKEMETYLNAKDDKNIEALLKRLQSKLQSGPICDKAFHSMVTLCNLMVQKKLPVKPCFPRYLDSVCAWNGNCGGHCVFEAWNEVHTRLLEHIPDRNLQPFIRFLDFSIDFFEKNALHVAQGGHTWQVVNADCRIGWDGNQPSLVIGETTLEAAWKENKITIEQTSGEYFPLTFKWVGKGGIVRWNHLDPSAATHCLLTDYQIELDKKCYTADRTTLVCPALFGEKRIPGKLTDKLLAVSNGEESSFPRFESSEGFWEIPNVVEGVNYRGGFALQGLALQGIAAAGEKATLEIFSKNKSKLATLKSDFFLMKQGGQLSGQGVEAVVFWGKNDSLYHSAVNVKLEPGKKMVFSAGEKSVSKSPWYDSYHRVFLFADRIDLDLATGNFEIQPKPQGQGGFGQRLYVESEHFFDRNLYHRLQNVATIHPLAIIAKMAKEHGAKLEASDLARRIHPNFTIANIQSLLFDLETNGFIRYNPEQQSVEVLNRTLHFAGAAMNQKDSDVLRLESSHNETNAFIHVQEKTITLEGVENFYLHARPKVAVLPKNKQVVLKQNRGLDFAGKIFAGSSVLEGSGFHFDYEKFAVNADSVLTFDLYLPTGGLDAEGQPKTAAIGSRIERTSGILLVNAPSNKNGSEMMTLFPAFVTQSPAFVFYDLRNEQGDCYGRDSFFFHLAPFTFNHLGNISPKDLQFEGTMVSGGIFPDFEEKLVLRPQDKSLGFTTSTPKTGYPIYTKGNFTGSMHLDNSGFKGEGELTYFATNLEAKDFLFKPRQLTCTADSFDLKEDFSKSIPKVHGEDVNIEWLPQVDSMFITSRSKSFQLFNDGSHEIGGMLIYMPSGLKGRGIFKWGEGQMKADLFAFGSHSVKSEKTDLQIKAFDTGQLALETKNLKGNIDFKENKGRFSANERTEVTTMPFNNYITTLNDFEWDLGKKSLTFLPSKGQKGWFLSTDGGQDSLQFHGTSAIYDFDRGQLDVTGVTEIEAADALIIPAESKVKVLPGGAMEVLQNARIEASASNRYHQIVNATVTLKGRQNFEATGFYEYNLPGKPQLIELKSIVGRGSPGSVKALTTANTDIGEEKNFYLDNKTRFQGEVSLKSSDPWLGFDGFARLEVPILKENQWFEVKFQGDYKKLLIACEEPKNREGTPLHTGLFIDVENAFPYSSVLMPLTSKKDRKIFDAKGGLRFDAATDDYVFGDSAKIINPIEGGNVLHFSIKTAKVKAEGSFRLCENVTGIDVKVAGIANMGLDAALLANPALAKTDIAAEWVAGFDFALPKSLMKIMMADFTAPTVDAQPATYQNTELYRTTLSAWCTKPRKRGDALTELTLRNLFSLPEENVPATCVLGDLNMKWNGELQSFTLVQPRVALVSMDKEPVHRMVEALVEFHNPKNQDDRIYVWLKAANGHFYYFNYKKGILHVFSGNDSFNEAVKAMKDKDRMIELKKGMVYELQLTTPDLVDFFTKRMK